MAESVFRGIILFFDKIGVYDVILPFILVFTIMFAILEKTRVLGTEGEGGKFPRRNLNSMASFVIAFLVIASSQLVALINQAMANIVIMVLVSISFLLLVSLFRKGDQHEMDSATMAGVMVVMGIAVVLIFMHAIPYGKTNVLSFVLEFVSANWQSDWVGAIILMILIVWFMSYVTGESSPASSDAKKEK